MAGLAARNGLEAPYWDRSRGTGHLLSGRYRVWHGATVRAHDNYAAITDY